MRIEQGRKPFAIRPGGVNNKGLLNVDRSHAKVAFEYVSELFHPDTPHNDYDLQEHVSMDEEVSGEKSAPI